MASLPTGMDGNCVALHCYLPLTTFQRELCRRSFSPLPLPSADCSAWNSCCCCWGVLTVMTTDCSGIVVFSIISVVMCSLLSVIIKSASQHIHENSLLFALRVAFSSRIVVPKRMERGSGLPGVWLNNVTGMLLCKRGDSW